MEGSKCFCFLFIMERNLERSSNNIDVRRVKKLRKQPAENDC